MLIERNKIAMSNVMKKV